jgi:TPR repeat protein
MPTSDEYSKLAEEYVRLAREAKNETDRLACLDLAQKWLEQAGKEQKLEPKLEPVETPKSETQQALSGWLKQVLGIFRWGPQDH